MIFYQLFEHESSTFTYLLGDEKSREAVIIDPVKETVQRDLGLLKDLELNLKYVLETHVHADHITGAAFLKTATGARTLISKGSGLLCADRLLSDGDEVHFGEYTLTALATPGHTDSCMCFYIPGMVFTGDTLLIRGTGRTDFQQGNSERLYENVHKKLFTLPPETIVYPGHNYVGIPKSTIDLEMRLNLRVGGGRSKEEFVKIMAGLNLAYPKKIDLALPANQKCGEENVKS